jgi:hypothetical protein
VSAHCPESRKPPRSLSCGSRTPFSWPRCFLNTSLPHPFVTANASICRWWPGRRNRSKLHFWLVFGRERGRGGGRGYETTKRNTSDSHVDASEMELVAEGTKASKKKPPTRVSREVEVEAEALILPEITPPARIWTRGR